jgi:predicted phage terminase large subunit-like protein
MGRKIGEALGRYSKAQLEKMRRSMAPRDWLSLNQQRPTALEGSYFKPAMINRLKGPMTFDLIRFYQAWDLALTPEQINNGDYSVGVNIGIDPLGRWWLTDICRGHWSPEDLAKNMCKFWHKHKAKMVWMEGGPPFLGVEPSLRNTMQRDGIWLPYEKVSHRNLPKDIRAISIRGIINGGNLYTDSAAPWWYDLEEELAQFPSGKHDDIVDALAYIGLKQDIMLKDKDRRDVPKAPPAVERSQMVKRAYQDIVNKAKAARRGGDHDDW